MGADYSFYVKSIATYVLTFFGYIILVLASVGPENLGKKWPASIMRIKERISPRAKDYV
jgi:hypothetical protein